MRSARRWRPAWSARIRAEPDVTKKPKKGGRPRKELDQTTFEGLCEIQATLEEIAGVLRVSEDTVERWCERTYDLGFAECYKKFSAEGKSSLRRAQFKLAQTNATMAIWLGKQWLGQRDRPSEEPNEEISPEEAMEELRSILQAAAQRHAAIQSRVGKEGIAAPKSRKH